MQESRTPEPDNTSPISDLPCDGRNPAFSTLHSFELAGVIEAGGWVVYLFPNFTYEPFDDSVTQSRFTIESPAGQPRPQYVLVAHARAYSNMGGFRPASFSLELLHAPEGGVQVQDGPRPNQGAYTAEGLFFAVASDQPLQYRFQKGTEGVDSIAFPPTWCGAGTRFHEIPLLAPQDGATGLAVAQAEFPAVEGFQLVSLVQSPGDITQADSWSVEFPSGKKYEKAGYTASSCAVPGFHVFNTDDHVGLGYGREGTIKLDVQKAQAKQGMRFVSTQIPVNILAFLESQDLEPFGMPTAHPCTES